MDDSADSDVRPVDRVTARVVSVVAVLFFLSGLGAAIRAVTDDRSPLLGVIVMALAVLSLVRARRKSF